MRRLFFYISILCIVCSTLLLTSCFNFKPQEDPTCYFSLKSLTKKPWVNSQMPQIFKNKTIGIHKIKIPSYLETEYIVHEPAPFQVNLAEFHRWSEPLQMGISRVLKENMVSFWPSVSIQTYPFFKPLKNDFLLFIEIIDFKYSCYVQVVYLKVIYRIYSKKSDKNIYEGHFEKSIPVNNTYLDYAFIVEAMSLALKDLSNNIIQQLQSLNT